MNEKSVAVLLVNYKSSELVLNLVQSISEKNVECTFFVLDNESTDVTYKPLCRIVSEKFKLFRSEQNLGFTGGINFLISRVEEDPAVFRYVFLLNPDASLGPDVISGLLACMNNKPDVAAVSPLIFNTDGSPWYTGGVLNFKRGSVESAGLRDEENDTTCIEVDVFSGCAVLFDVEKLIHSGMFNEKLFMYYDEAELSIRLKKSGYKVLYCPFIKIFHDVSFTTRKISHRKTYYMTRNKFLVFSKTMPVSYKIYFLLHELGYHLKYFRPKNALFHLKGFVDSLYSQREYNYSNRA
jgi:GT2 family glycosyltransferase